MKNTTELKGITVEASWHHQGQPNLGFRILDPISGVPIAEVTLDQTQIIAMLSSTHTGYVGGEFRIFHTGLSRIGKQHVMVDVVVPYSTYGDDAVLNQCFERAWVKAGGFPWEPVVVRGFNGHHIKGNTYVETMHGWFDYSLSLDDILNRFDDHLPDTFSRLRTMKDNN